MSTASRRNPHFDSLMFLLFSSFWKEWLLTPLSLLWRQGIEKLTESAFPRNENLFSWRARTVFCVTSALSHIVFLTYFSASLYETCVVDKKYDDQIYPKKKYFTVISYTTFSSNRLHCFALVGLRVAREQQFEVTIFHLDYKNLHVCCFSGLRTAWG